MTKIQWDELIAVVNGTSVTQKDIGFIIDSPWLPGWSGIATLDYYSSDEIWLKTNLKAMPAVGWRSSGSRWTAPD